MDRQLDTGRSHRPAGSFDSRLGAKEIELRLDDEQIDAPVDETRCLDLIGCGELLEGDLTQGGELGPGADRPGDKARTAIGLDVPVDHSPCQSTCGRSDLIGLVRYPVLGERNCERSESIGFDDVDAHVEKRSVQIPDHIGPTKGENVDATIELGPTEVIVGQTQCLEVGAGGAVEDDNPGSDGVEIRHHGLSLHGTR